MMQKQCMHIHYSYLFLSVSQSIVPTFLFLVILKITNLHQLPFTGDAIDSLMQVIPVIWSVVVLLMVALQRTRFPSTDSER